MILINEQLYTSMKKIILNFLSSIISSHLSFYEKYNADHDFFEPYLWLE